MSPRSPRLVAVATFVAVALAGAAFVKTSAERASARRQVEAAAAADRAAAALEAEVASVFAQLGRVRSGGLPEIRRDRIESLLLTSQGRIVARLPANAAPPIGDDDIAALEGTGPALIGPLRGAGGARKVAARVPAQVRDLTRASVVAVLDLNSLLGLTAGPALRGYDYRIVAAGGNAALLHRTSEAALEAPVSRDVRVGPGRWTLSAAPSRGWVRPDEFALHAVLTFVLALAASLVAYDLARARGVLLRALAEKGERLRAVNRRLVEETHQREAFEKQFSHASFHDALTGLPTRRLLVNRLEKALVGARTGTAGPVASAALALDRLRAASDRLGPGAADEIVVQVARRIEAALGSAGAVLGRLGDAEFGFVIPGASAREQVIAIVDRAHRALDEPFEVAGQRLFVGAHAGIAFSQSGYDHPDDLLRGAQIALSAAQREHLPHAVFDPSTQDQVVSRHQIETDLHRVAERGELRVVFQPVVALADGRIAGLEALVRWQHPVEGLLAPGRFIGIAEDAGLITPITRWMVEAACEQAAAWLRERPGSPFYVSVNLSACDMRDASIGDHVEAVLERTGIPPAALRLEVTESSMVDNVRGAEELLARFRAMGVKLLLDDFGTGYSSLSYLHRFQLDYVKIDQSFVRRMTPDPKSSSVVRAILSLADGMGLHTVAEGIEDAEVAALLRTLGCGFGQGYYYARPVDAARAGILLAGERLPA